MCTLAIMIQKSKDIVKQLRTHTIFRIEPFYEMCKKHWIILSGFVVCIISVIKSYTLAHPYLLADNRHYTFYIWRKIITRTDLTPILLTPVYTFGVFSVLYSLRRTELAFKIAFPLCVVINLLPQYLLEFRYFVIPFILHRLQVRPQSWWSLIAEMVLFQIVNIVTIYLFLFKPFHWQHEPEQIQRFMW